MWIVFILHPNILPIYIIIALAIIFTMGNYNPYYLTAMVNPSRTKGGGRISPYKCFFCNNFFLDTFIKKSHTEKNCISVVHILSYQPQLLGDYGVRENYEPGRGFCHFLHFFAPKRLNPRFCSIFRVLMIHAI